MKPSAVNDSLFTQDTENVDSTMHNFTAELKIVN